MRVENFEINIKYDKDDIEMLYYALKDFILKKAYEYKERKDIYICENNFRNEVSKEMKHFEFYCNILEFHNLDYKLHLIFKEGEL